MAGALPDTDYNEPMLTEYERDHIRVAIANSTILDDVDINCYEYFGTEIPMDGEHGYFTKVGTPDHYLPWNYWLYAEDNLVLEVKGVPSSWTAKVFMEWWNKQFTSFGTVIMTPTVTDLNTKTSWRWLIFETEEEKLRVKQVFGQEDGVRFVELANGSPSDGRLFILDNLKVCQDHDMALMYYIHNACDEWYKEKYTALVKGMMVKNSAHALDKEDVARMSLAELLVNQEKIPLELLKELAELSLIQEEQDTQGFHDKGKGKETMASETADSGLDPSCSNKGKEKETTTADTSHSGLGVSMADGHQHQTTAHTPASDSTTSPLVSFGHHQSMSNASTLVPQQPEFHTFPPGQPIMGPDSVPQFASQAAVQEYYRQFGDLSVNRNLHAPSVAAEQHAERARYVAMLAYRDYFDQLAAQGYQSPTHSQSPIQNQSSTQATSQLHSQFESMKLDQNGQDNTKENVEVHNETGQFRTDYGNQGIAFSAHQRNVSSKVLPEISPYLRDEPTFANLQPSAVAPANPPPTWANVLGQPSSPGHSKINLRPDQHLTQPHTAPRRLVSIGRIPEVEDIRSARESSEELEESQTEQMRVVFLLNLPQSITVTDISDAIREGPICSIRFGHDKEEDKRYAGVIFQYAENASKFVQILLHEKATSNPGRFKFCVDVALGDPFPLTDTLRQMGPPEYASRRLTLVKKAFFFTNGERHLRTMCETVVGAENIQKIFLYNGGNATIIFAEVQAAIKMKKVFEDKVLKERDWEGLQVNYSKDPCEVVLRFITEM